MRLSLGRCHPLMLLALASALLPAAASAAASQVGVWEGTVGGQPVMACFNDDLFGAYYYRRHLQAIHLEAMDKEPGHWFETPADDGNKTGTWTLSTIEADRIEGQWADPDGQHRSPIALARRPVADKDTPACGSSVFNAALEVPPKIIHGPPKTVDGKHYRTVTARAAQFSVATLELLEPGAAVSALNAQLKKQLPETPQSREDLYACAREALGNLGAKGETTVDITPLLWTDRYLVTQTTTETFCGGPYPATAITSTTWNVQSAQVEDVSKWLATGGVTGGVKTLMASYSDNPDSDCVDALAQAHTFDIRPDRKGLIFTPDLPHAVQACADEITVPYSALKPFLSAAGVAGAQSMQP